MKNSRILFIFCLLIQQRSVASDLINILPITDQIIALHFDDGRAVYHKKGERRTNEYVIINPLLIPQASLTSTYSLISTNDNTYRIRRSPVDIGRKTKGSEFTWLCQGWMNGCINNQPDHVKEHWIYLFLPEPLKNKSSYRLEIAQLASNGSVFQFTFDETQLQSPTLHTNLIGYTPEAPAKFGYLYHWMGDKGDLNLNRYTGRRFYIVQHHTNAVVFEGRVALRRPRTNGETGQINDTPQANFLGADVYECNFSAFKQPGKYRLVVDGMGCSHPFKIENSVYQDIFYTSIRGLYHNRSGIELKEPHTEFTRPAPHHPTQTPGFAGKLQYTTSRFIDWTNGDHSNADKPAIEAGILGSLDESWGWYQDAGDWDGYLRHLNIPTMLLFSWKIRPDNYLDNQLNLPESGNRIPDILDEAAWLPRYFYRIRHEIMRKGYGTGGVGGRVCGDHFGNDGEGRPSYEDINRTYIVSGEDPHTTYKYAAVAAQLAICFAQLGLSDPEGIDWKKEAIESYQWAKNNTRAGDENTKPAMPDRLGDFRAFAAASLLQLTQDPQYRDQVQLDLINLGSSDILRGEKLWGPFVVANLDNSLFSNLTIRTRCRNALITTADAMVTTAERRACRWGGDFNFPMLIGQATTPLIFEVILGYHITQTDNPAKAAAYLAVIHTTADYFLGSNPLNTTWITGLGIQRPDRVFHLDSWYNGKDEMVPGITPYGPWRHEFQFTGQGPWDVAWSYRSIYPESIHVWPGHERWFGNSPTPLNAEFTVDQNTVMNAVVYGFLNNAPKSDFISNRKPTFLQFTLVGDPTTRPTDSLTLRPIVQDPEGIDTIHKIEFYNGWQKIGESKNFPFIFKFTPKPGVDYQITAKVIDELGAYSFSEKIELRVEAKILSVQGEDTPLKIYPNPFSDKINFELGLNQIEPVELKIFNLSGQLIWQTTQNISSGSIHWTPNIRQNGIYLYQLSFFSPKKSIFYSGKIKFEP